jgi:hypothetical protein
MPKVGAFSSQPLSLWFKIPNNPKTSQPFQIKDREGDERTESMIYPISTCIDCFINIIVSKSIDVTID